MPCGTLLLRLRKLASGWVCELFWMQRIEMRGSMLKAEADGGDIVMLLHFPAL